MSGSFTENIKYLESRLNNNQHSTDKIKAAKYYLNNGNAKKAIELCKESLNDYPNYLTTYLILANSYISESNFTAAYETVKKADIYFPHHWAFESIKKLIWQSDLKDNSNTNTYFEEIHRSLFLSSNDEDNYSETDDTLDPIAATHKFSFNFDDYVPKQTKTQTASKDTSLDSADDDYITLNHFRPAAEDFAFDDDDIIKSLLNEGEIDAINKPKEEWHYVDAGIKLSQEYRNILKEEGIQLETTTPPIRKTDSPDKIILEKELDQLLGVSDFDLAKDGAIEDLSHIDNMVQEEQPSSPPLVSKTMADVYISQGKYNEAIFTYSELLKKKEITIQEYDACMQALQEKLSPPDINI
jgi:tetratricopeptide (TPR) repeat protein